MKKQTALLSGPTAFLVVYFAAQSFGGLRPITDAQVEDLVEAFNLPKE